MEVGGKMRKILRKTLVTIILSWNLKSEGSILTAVKISKAFRKFNLKNLEWKDDDNI